MNRSRRALFVRLYRVGVGAAGILAVCWLIPQLPWRQIGLPLVCLTGVSVLIKQAGFHVTPQVIHSLVGVIDLAVVMLFGPVAGGVAAALSELIYYGLHIWRRRRFFQVEIVEAALFSVGLKIPQSLVSGWLYGQLGGSDLATIGPAHILALTVLFVSWFVLDHLGWAIIEWLSGGWVQVWAFLRTIWRISLMVELLPLWASVLIAFVYAQGNMFVLVLLLMGLIAVALVVRRLADSWQQARRQLDEMIVLNRAGRAIVGAQLDVDQVCELIYQQASQIVDTSIFHLGLFENGDQYAIKIWVRDHVRLPAQTFPGAAHEGIVGWMRQSGQPLLVRDFQREMDSLPARPRYISDHPPRSAVFVPLLVDDKVIGAISIQHPQPDAFDQDHLRLLSLIGNQAAMAIEKARLYEKEHRRLQQMALIDNVSRQVAAILDLDTLCRRVVQLIQQTFGYYHVGIFSLTPGTGELVSQTNITMNGETVCLLQSVGEGIVGWVAQNGQPLLANDVSAESRYLYRQSLPETRSELAVPLQVEGQTWGVLDVQSDRRDAFGEDDLFILQTLAAQVAVAMVDARLYAAEQESAWMSTALLQVAEATSKLSNLTDVLTTVTRLTPMLTGVDRCGILLWERRTGLWLPTESFGLSAEQQSAFALLRLDRERAPLFAEIQDEQAPRVLSDHEIRTLPADLMEWFDIGHLLILPLVARGEPLGLMLVDYVESTESFNERKVGLLSGIANQVAVAIENAQLYTSQQEQAYVSTALLQVSEAVRSLTDLSSILETIVRITPILVGVERCGIFLRDEPQDSLVLVQQYNLAGSDPDWLELGHLDVEHPLSRQIMNGYPAIGVQDDLPEHWFYAGLTPVRAGFPVLALPLVAKGYVLGALLVDYIGAPEWFAERWVHILNGIASQTAIAIENVQLYRQQAERQRLSRELEVAREIQASFLPDQCPDLPGWEMQAFWRSASQVGGDFYDVFMLPDGRVGLIVADVADKGIPAALFMALSRTLLRVVAQDVVRAAATLERVNDLIISDTRSDLFVTVFYAILDPLTGELIYANGGHNPPLLVRRNGDVESLRARGIVLGILTPIHLEERRVELEPGDVLLLYTDGITDTINADEEIFGAARLADLARRERSRSPGDLLTLIQAEIAAFAGDMPQFDDLTMVALKRSV